MAAATAARRTPASGEERAGAGAGVAPGGLELDGVGFGYPDGVEVLDGITTTIEPGATVGIVGPSGCGKSTLLSLVAGLLDVTSGRLLRGEAEPGRHPLSMVFQKDTLLPWLTVEDNVRFFTRFRRHGLRRSLVRRDRGPGDAELAERVTQLLELGHLGDRADAYPYQLSGGMRRRLQFLAGVAPHPQMLLLDEPFSSVDEPTRIGIHQDVYRITRTLGMTTILVTHDLAEAITLCDRVLILSNRPARIAKEHTIDFGAERDMLNLRRTSEYLERYGRLWDDLSEQIARSRAGRPT